METIKTWARRMLVDPWQEADFEADRQRSACFDWRPAVILTTTVVVLAVMEYFGNDSTFSHLVPYDANLYDREQWDLWARVWWAGIRVLAYVVIPCATVLLMPGERLRDYYLSAQGLRGHLWIYAVLRKRSARSSRDWSLERSRCERVRSGAASRSTSPWRSRWMAWRWRSVRPPGLAPAASEGNLQPSRLRAPVGQYLTASSTFSRSSSGGSSWRMFRNPLSSTSNTSGASPMQLA
mgnify:CR=1 FL=1